MSFLEYRIKTAPSGLRKVLFINWPLVILVIAVASVGILMHWLATQPDWQRRLRAEPALLPAAIDEVLRIDGPLVANRRITREAVELGGQALAAGERLSINWIAANRDPRALTRPMTSASTATRR